MDRSGSRGCHGCCLGFDDRCGHGFDGCAGGFAPRFTPSFAGHRFPWGNFGRAIGREVFQGGALGHGRAVVTAVGWAVAAAVITVEIARGTAVTAVATAAEIVFIAGGFDGCAAFACLEEVHEGGGDVGGVETFFKEAFEQGVLAFEFTGLEHAAQFAGGGVGAGLLDFGLGRGFAPAHFDFGEALDLGDKEDFTSGGEGEGDTRAAGAAGAADTVKVVFGIVGQVVVDHDLDVIDVDAAGRHIGGHEEFEARFAELVHDAVAHGLAHVAVEAVGRVALGVQMIDEVVDHALGVTENDAQLEIVDVDEAGEELDFVAAIDLVVDLFDGGDGLRGLLDFDGLGIASVFADEVLDGLGHGGREENGLPFLGHALEDDFDVVAEAHVEHDVGFVEDDHFDVFEAKGAAAHVVHDAAGGANDDLDALFEAHELALVGLASVDGHGVDAAFEEEEFVDFLGDLDGEFAGGAEDEGLHGALAGFDFFNGGDGEGSGFAGAGLGLADDVVAGHEDGDGFGLDGGGFFVAQLVDGLQHFG